MIGCLILAFALCQVPAPGYYVTPQGYAAPGYQPGYPAPAVAYAPQQYYAPAPVYYAPAYGPAYGYGGPPIALNFRFGGWGWGGRGWGGGWHR